MLRRPPGLPRPATLLPYPTLFRSELDRRLSALIRQRPSGEPLESRDAMAFDAPMDMAQRSQRADDPAPDGADAGADSRDGSPSAAEHESGDRKSTRLNSSH